MENPNFQMGETALGESDTDSIVCGKRKRWEIQEKEKIDSGGCGGDIAKINSAMAKKKKTRQVAKFEDRYGLFWRYEGKMALEDEDYDPMRKDDDYSSEEDGKGNLHMLEGFGNEDEVIYICWRILKKKILTTARSFSNISVMPRFFEP